MLCLRWKRRQRSSGHKDFCRDSVQELHHVRVGWGQLPPGSRWPGTEPPHLWLLPTVRAFLNSSLSHSLSREKKLLSSAKSNSLGSIHLLCINSSHGHHRCHRCCRYHHHHHLSSISCVKHLIWINTGDLHRSLGNSYYYSYFVRGNESSQPFNTFVGLHRFPEPMANSGQHDDRSPAALGASLILAASLGRWSQDL